MRKLALLLLAAPLVLAACGSSSSAPVAVDPVAYVKHAAQQTAALPSEHMTMRGTIGMGPTNVTVTSSGDFDAEAKKGQMNIGVGVSDVVFSMKEVTDGTTIYVQSPLFASQLPSGKSWAKIDVEALARSGAEHTKLLSSLMSRSPAQTLKQLLAAGSVKSIDAEIIDGVETTEYQITDLDMSKMPHGAQFQALAHPRYGPIDVWIGNSNGYVRRVSLPFTYTVDDQSATVSMDFRFSKFGETVNVKVPSASETVDFSTLMNDGMGLGI